MRIMLLLSVLATVFVAGCIGDGPQETIDNITNSTVKDSIESNLSGLPDNESSESLSSEIKSFDITVGHTFITPSVITVKKGDTVKFNVRTAEGTESHNHGITIDAYSINVANTDPSNPTVVTFIAAQEGEFSIYCKTCWDGPFGRGHPDIRSKLVVK